MPNTDTAKENARERVNHDFYKAFKMYHGRVDVYEVLALRYAEKLEEIAEIANAEILGCKSIEEFSEEMNKALGRIAALTQ